MYIYIYIYIYICRRLLSVIFYRYNNMLNYSCILILVVYDFIIHSNITISTLRHIPRFVYCIKNISTSVHSHV